MITIPSVSNLLMKTIYLSHGTMVAEGTVFKKHTVFEYTTRNANLFL